jgi:ATP-dependent helicase/nuclease subunit B
MRKLYTGPYGPMARMVWTEKAKTMIREGCGEQFLYILPTGQLLKKVRDDLLHSLGGISTVHLLTFDEIAERIIGELSPGAELLTTYELNRFYDQVLTSLADHPMMSEFNDYFHLRGVRTSLMKMMGEWKRSGFTIHQAEQLVSDLSSSTRSRALAFFFIESEKYLKALSISNGYPCMTRESRLYEAAKVLQEQPLSIEWLQSINTLWVDQFTDFSPLQFELLTGLVQLGNVQQVGIYLPYQAEYCRNLNYLDQLMNQALDDLGALGLDLVNISSLTDEEAVNQLSQDWGVNLTPDTQKSLQDKKTFTQLSKTLFAGCEMSSKVPVELISFPTAKKEVQFVCKRVKQQLLDDPTLCLSDIAIIARDGDRFQPIIEEEFERAELPLQLQKNPVLTEVPLVQQLTAFLEVKLKGWHRDALIKLTQGAYVEWTHPITDSVSVWMKKKGLVEGEFQWAQLLTYDLELLEKRKYEVNSDGDLLESELRSVLQGYEREKIELIGARDWFVEVKDKLSLFPAEGTMLEYLEASHKWLASCRIPQRLLTLGKYPQYTKDLLRRDVQAWKAIGQSLEELRRSAEKLGELQRSLSLSAFVTEWTELWREHSIQSKQGNPQGIVYLEPSAARGLNFKQVYVIGCNEGIFPKAHRENWLLDDVERMLIQEYGTLPASHYHNEMERMFFLMAVSLASKQLVFSFVSGEAAGSAQPSSFIYTLLKTMPALEVVHPTDNWASVPEEIASEEEYRQWLAKAGKSVQPSIQLYREEWFPRPLFLHVLDGLKVEQQRHFGYFSEWDGNLKGDAIQNELAKIFSSARRFSVSQINEYISSPLTFFFRRILGVQTPDEWTREVAPIDKGNILHESLRRFYSRHRGEQLSSSQLPNYRMELLEYFHEEAKRFAQGTAYEKSKLWELEVLRLARELRDWLDNELKDQHMEGFFPAFLELSFGLPFTDPEQVDPASQADCVDLHLGVDQIRLYGKIDRIDCDSMGHFIVYDYKLSLGKYGDYKELSDGTFNYQLPLYLALGKQWLKARGGGEPLMVGGAFYSLRKRDQFKKVGMWSEEKRDLIGLSKRSKKGIFSALDARVEEDLMEIQRFLRALKQGDFFLTAKQRPNPYYADNAIYRYDAISIRHKEKQKENEM